MLVMWAVLLFFVGLVIREQRLVRHVREHIALPLVMPWFEVTAKIAAVNKADSVLPDRASKMASDPSGGTAMDSAATSGISRHPSIEVAFTAPVDCNMAGRVA